MSKSTIDAASLPPHPPLRLPRVIFGSTPLGNLFEAPSYQQKLAIMQACVEHGEAPVTIDSAGKYGAGLALEMIGKTLRELGVDGNDVVISNKLGWYRTPLTTAKPSFEPDAWIDLEHDAELRISRKGILECWEQGCELLGEPYRPQLISVHDPDEYFAAAIDSKDRARRKQDVLEAYESLAGLKQRRQAQAIGVGAKDWRAAKEVADAVELDWVMIANSLTLYTHPPEMLAWLDSLQAKGVTVINSALFNAGFLVGGKFFDYRLLAEDSKEDQAKLAWRERFFALCEKYSIQPAAACVQFGLSHPAVASIAMSSTKPERVAECITLSKTLVPNDFWSEAKEIGLIDATYPHV